MKSFLFFFFLIFTTHNVFADAPDTEQINKQIIKTSSSKASDKLIKTKILAIYNEFETLKDINVTVNEGVVVLSGKVANEKNAKTAMNIANRVSGIVTVKDSLERTLKIQDNINPVINNAHSKMTNFVKAIPLIIIAIIIFIIISYIGVYISNFKKIWQHITPNSFLADIVSQVIKIFFLFTALIVSLSIFNADKLIGTILGGAGVVGIAIGFAVKDTIENYISSIILSIRQPFREKDHVVINDMEGIVVRLTSRATILMTLDGNNLRIPNSQVFKGVILNYSSNPERRIVTEYGIDSNDNPMDAMELGLNTINELPFILKHPKTTAIISKIGDSNIVIKFFAWINQNETDFAKAKSLIINVVKNALEKHDFTLPEPIYRVLLDSKNVTSSPLNGIIQKGAQESYQKPQKEESDELELEDIDVKVDNHISEKVDEENSQEEKEKNLLSENAQHE